MTLEQKAAAWAAQLAGEEGWEPERALLHARRAYGLVQHPTRATALQRRHVGEDLSADLRDLGPDMPRETRRAMVTWLATSSPGIEGERVHRSTAEGKSGPRPLRKVRRYVGANRERA